MPKKGRLAIHGGSRAVPDNLKLMKWPDIREEDKIAVTSVLERGIIHGAHSPEITGLERDWSEYADSGQCIQRHLACEDGVSEECEKGRSCDLLFIYGDELPLRGLRHAPPRHGRTIHHLPPQGCPREEQRTRC